MVAEAVVMCELTPRRVCRERCIMGERDSIMGALAHSALKEEGNCSRERLAGAFKVLGGEPRELLMACSWSYYQREECGQTSQAKA